jgi:hypothetical protein
MPPIKQGKVRFALVIFYFLELTLAECSFEFEWKENMKTSQYVRMVFSDGAAFKFFNDTVYGE